MKNLKLKAKLYLWRFHKKGGLSDDIKNLKESILARYYSLEDIEKIESQIEFNYEGPFYLRALIEKNYSCIKDKIQNNLHIYIEEIKNKPSKYLTSHCLI